MKININQIKVPEDRQRKHFDPKKAEEMRLSLKAVGQINPIIVDEDNNLIAGERRLQAAKKLGWTEIEVKIFNSFYINKEIGSKLVELFENTHRQDIEWQERAKAISKITEHLKELGKSSDEISLELGLSDSMIRKTNAVMRAAKKNPDILKVKTIGTAITAATRQKQRAESEVMEELDRFIDGKPDAPKVTLPAEILNANFIEWAKTYDGERFHAVHLDFPYGIDTGSAKHATAKVNLRNEAEAYDDSEETYLKLLHALLDNEEKIFAIGAHIMCWLHPKFLDYTKIKFKEKGFNFAPYPLVWLKNQGIVPDPKYTPMQVYEVALFGWRDRPLVTGFRNAYNFTPDKRYGDHIHATQKDIPVLEHFMKSMIDKNTRFLDPTCGSGNAVKVATKMGAKYSLGIEMNEHYASAAKKNLEN